MFYQVDPDVVDYGWTNRDFLDRQEYMWATNAYQKRYRKWIEKNK
jgi:hypothetical protein